MHKAKKTNSLYAANCRITTEKTTISQN